MDAESSRAVTEDETSTPGAGESPTGDSADSPTDSGDSAADAGQAKPSGGDLPVPARRFTSAGDRLQATMAAADTAAEEILDAARAEARELIERAEQVATDRTAQLQTQAEILLARAGDLTRQAEALGEATRELTSSVNRVVSIEAPAVTELELPAGEPAAGEAPQLAAAAAEEGGGEAEAPAGPVAAEPAADEPDAVLDEPEAVLEELGAIAAAPEPPLAQDEVVETPAPGNEETAPQEAAAGPLPPAAAEAAATEVAASAEAQAPVPAEPERAGERSTGSQPPPVQAKPPAPEPAAAPPEGKKRRSLFSRLIHPGESEEPTETPAQTSGRPRASEEAIAEVSPGHQMLARQMLLDGVSEADVERRLRDEFRVRDPGAVLDSLQHDTPLISPTKAEEDE